MKYDGFFTATELWHKENQNAWQIQMVTEIDATEMDGIRESYRRRGAPVPTYTALVIQAIALGIQELKPHFPTLLSYVRKFLCFKSVHVFDEISCGFSVSHEIEGREVVMGNVIHSPHTLSLEEITRALHQSTDIQNVNKARETMIFYKLPKWIQSFLMWGAAYFPKARLETRGSFNFTSVGHLGVDFHTLPQSASLQWSMGYVKPRVIVKNGTPTVAKTFYLVCSLDRRLISAKSPALLCRRVAEILETSRELTPTRSQVEMQTDMHAL